MYNFQTVTLPDQEKFIEKIDLRYLKILNIKRLITQIPQTKYCPCSKYEDIQTRFVQSTDKKKQLQSVA